MLGFPVPHRLLEFAQVHVHCISDAIEPSHPLLLFLQPSISSSIRVFSNESVVCIRWPKYWSFSFCISPSNEYSGLISLKIDLFDFLAVKGILKSFLQHHSSKASILQRSAFFMVQLSQLYVNTTKIIGLTVWTFVGKVMSLFFFKHTKFVIAFLPTSSGFMAAVTIHSEFRAQEEETCHCFYHFPFYLPCSKGARCNDLIIIILLIIFTLKLALSLSSFTLMKRLFSSSSLSAIRVVSSMYLRLLMFLPPILILACNSFSLGFLKMCSAYRLNKQGDRRQPCHTPFSILTYQLFYIGLFPFDPHPGFSGDK